MKLHIPVIVMLVFSSVFIIIPFAEESVSAWDGSDYDYFKICNIANNILGYQMKIVIGKSSGGNVSCGGHCQDDFDDIRFLNDDNSTEYSYWRENFTSGVQATFWVNLSANDTKLLLVYGNAGVSTTSNGNTTFCFFDDFSGTAIDTSRWEQTGLVNPLSYSESGGLLNFSATGNGFYGWNSIRDISKPFIVESRVKYYTVNTYCGWAGTVWSDTTHWVAWVANGADTVSAATKDGSLSYDASTYPFGNNVWSRTSVYWKAGQAYYQRNFTTMEALSTNVLSTVSASVGLVLNTGASGPAHGICFDFVFARKYTSSTVPTWSSFSSESAYAYVAPPFPITVSGVYPALGSVDVETNPELKIQVNHTSGDKINVTFHACDISYHEDADTTVDVFGLGTNIFDGDWTTYEESDGNSRRLTMNYTTLYPYVSGVRWMLLDSKGYHNFSINSSVYSLGYVLFKLELAWGDSEVVDYYVWYDSAWFLLRNNVSTNRVYEEGLFINSTVQVGCRNQDFFNQTYEGCSSNQTFYCTYRNNVFDVFSLNHKYSWYVNITDGDGHSRNFPNESSDGDAYSTWYLYNFTTGSVNNTDDVVFIDNTVNTSGGYVYDYVNGTGGHPGEWYVTLNQEGDTTPLHLLEYIINATGTHTYLQNATGYWVNASYTGTGNASGSVITVTTNNMTLFISTGVFIGVFIGLIIRRKRKKLL